MKNQLLLLLFIAMVFSPVLTSAQPAWGYDNNRIAISADGNSAPDNEYKWPTGDPDDWGANAAILGIIAKLDLHEKVVHFSYNNFIDAPAGPDAENQNLISCVEGIEQFGGFNPCVFFDVTTHLGEARTSLALEMAKSTESDPLYFIHAGLSEFLYQVVEEVIVMGKTESLKHVFLLSHSGFNEKEIRRPNHRTWAQVQQLCGNKIQYKKIPDQNDCNNPNNLWCSGSDFSVWYWMRDHKDPKVRWMYSRLTAHSGNKADISDCGMVYYLLTGDDNGNPTKFEIFIGEGIPYKQPVTCDSECIIEENNGVLIFEAERFSLKGNWKVIEDVSASGGKFIAFGGPNLYPEPKHENSITYKFKINNPGHYTVKWFMRQPEGEQGTDKSNDAWIYLPNNTGYADTTLLEHFEKFYGRSNSEFVFNGIAEVHGIGHKWLTARFETPGVYSIKLSGRSENLQIDRIVMYKNMTFEEAEAKAKIIQESSKCYKD